MAARALPIVCFDFDGTLVDPEGRIHPADVAILGCAPDVVLVPATGRPLQSVRHTLRAHGLFTDRPMPFPLVLENGAMVYDAGEVVRRRSPFDPEIRDALIDAMLDTPGLTFFAHQSDEVRVLWPSEAGERMIERFRLQTARFDPADRDGSLTKVVAIAATVEPLRAFEARTAALAMERALSLPTVLEFNAAGIDKGTGLSSLLEVDRRGAPIVVAGDGGNDLPLFPLADLSFAPRESLPAILEQADHVIDVAERGLLTPILEAIDGCRGRGRSYATRMQPF